MAANQMHPLQLSSQIALAHEQVGRRHVNLNHASSHIALAHYRNDAKPIHDEDDQPLFAETEHKEFIEPRNDNRFLLSDVEEIFIAGGGGAGRALPAALREAHRFGLDFKNKVKVVCATSVGSIAGLAVVLGVPPQEMKPLLEQMPTNLFQDWSWKSIITFFRNWGLCHGRVMPDYFKAMIKRVTGLDDPTFQELYRAGYKKEFRVIVANASTQRIVVLSHRTHPHLSVAEAVARACRIPLLYPPSWLVNHRGENEAYVDGGLIKNYPFGIGSDPNTDLNKQLGFIFVNKAAAYSLHNIRHHPLRSLWRFIYNLITMVIFQHPLCLPNSIKNRTVAIAVNHNPFKFTATPAEQVKLDKAGSDGVRRLLTSWVKRRHQRAPNKGFLPGFANAKQRKLTQKKQPEMLVGVNNHLRHRFTG